MGVLVFLFVTFVLSAILGLFCTITVSPSRKDRVQGLDLFTDVCTGSFIGGLLGGIVGVIICANIALAFIPESDGMFIGLAAFAYLPFVFTLIFLYFGCWELFLLQSKV